MMCAVARLLLVGGNLETVKVPLLVGSGLESPRSCDKVTGSVSGNWTSLKVLPKV